MSKIMEINGIINNFVWGPYMLILLVGTGVFFSIRTNFLQVRRFGYVMRNTVATLFSKDKVKASEGNVTPFQAVSTALASTVGTGNVVGVATAIVSGGPGAVFWMWVSAFFGMMTKYSEVVLAIKYRETDENGIHYGGPMYYIEKGLHMKWLAVLFAAFGAIATFGIGNIAQGKSIADAVSSTIGLPPFVTGIIVIVFVALVIIGGITRIAKVTEKLVPFMATFYIVGGVIFLLLNITHIPAALGLIFKEAFSLRSVGGGILGTVMMSAMRYGFARGVFSNEAGLGSAPIAHAAAHTDDPVKQGLWGVFEVFVDTIIICSITGLVIIISGLYESGAKGAELTIAAFSSVFGSLGGYFVTIAIALFALSTMLGWSYYGERCLSYLVGKESKTVVMVYRVLFLIIIIFGCLGGLTFVWDLSDTLNGLMAIPNLIGILGLSGVVVQLTREHFSNNKLD